MGQSQFKHPKSAIPLLLSIGFERGTYYAIQSLIILYLVDQFSFSYEEAPEIYQKFMLVLSVSYLVGGFLSDFLLKKQKSILLGLGIGILSCFLLANPQKDIVFLGLLLMAIGTAIFRPSSIALYGELYYARLRLVDSGFSWLMFSINIFSFLGVLVIATISGNFGYQVSFLFCALGYIMAMFFYFLQPKNIEKPIVISKRIKSIDLSVLILFLVIAISLIFSLADSISSQDIVHFTKKIPLLKADEYSIKSVIQKFWLKEIDAVITILFLSVFAILWSRKYSHTFQKLIRGLTIALFAYLVMQLSIFGHLFHLTPLILFLITIGIAEAIITPVLNALIVRYVPKEFLSVAFGAFFFLVYVLWRISGEFEKSVENFGVIIAIAIIGFTLLTVFIIYKQFLSKRE